MKPELLLHPNIPKPLHGLNPRTVKGKEWWDEQRVKAYKKYNYRCWACGVHKKDAIYHQWLEGHEFYKYDYSKGRASLVEIVALCHCCHNFIHNGKTEKDYKKRNISLERFVYIMQHGTNILYKAGLPMNIFALSVIKRNNLDIEKLPKYIQAQDVEVIADWEDWRLEIDGELYAPIHKNFDEWKERYK